MFQVILFIGEFVLIFGVIVFGCALLAEAIDDNKG